MKKETGLLITALLIGAGAAAAGSARSNAKKKRKIEEEKTIKKESTLDKIFDGVSDFLYAFGDDLKKENEVAKSKSDRDLFRQLRSGSFSQKNAALKQLKKRNYEFGNDK